jgi:hypothetical protein
MLVVSYICTSSIIALLLLRLRLLLLLLRLLPECGDALDAGLYVTAVAWCARAE